MIAAKEAAMRWTAEDIPDQRGRTAIVTGANSGIGLSAARELARAGASVTLACRNLDKGQAAFEAIKRAAPDAAVHLAELDLASLSSVERFAGNYADGHERLDMLINNAGVMAPPRRLTADGFELQFGTNHLGHFALTARLFTLLVSTPGSRVVNVSSGAHRSGRIDFDDLHGERSYSRWGAYGQSKLSNLLFTFELDRRVRAAVMPVTAVAAHPGYAATNLQSASSSGIEAMMMALGNATLAQSADMGALPTLYAATHPAIEGGAYVGPDGWFEMRGYPRLVDCTAAARDEEAARRLWTISEELTGLPFVVEQQTSEAPIA
jgi:NAD(P)-dependent dehydrogenase (short-subunit alcohol dehydrogenase family)